MHMKGHRIQIHKKWYVAIAQINEIQGKQIGDEIRIAIVLMQAGQVYTITR
jgi:hypothetical protein